MGVPQMSSARGELDETSYHKNFDYHEHFGTVGIERGCWFGKLNAFLKEWKSNSNVSKEEFWQTIFAKNAVVLSQLFAYPVILIKDKAYRGRKDLMNISGQIVDFLCKLESTGVAALVEIKTPPFSARRIAASIPSRMTWPGPSRKPSNTGAP